jgi:small subunit ribosomal protein S21
MSEYKGNRRSKNNFKQPRREGENKASFVSDNKFKISEAIQAQPLEVKVYGNNFDKAMRAFRALVQKERILSAYKEKQSYEKPSDKRRRKVNESKRKQLELCSKGECRHSEHSQNRKLRNSKHSSE